MVEIQVRGNTVEFLVLGLHNLWAFKHRLSVPTAALRRARRLEAHEAWGWWKGWRIPGTHLPGVLVAGTFYRRGERHFWDVARAERAIVVELSDASYDKLFVEVEDPDAALALLKAAGHSD